MEPETAYVPKPDSREKSPADRVRLAHAKSAGANSEELVDDERGARILALIADVLLAAMRRNV